MKRTKVVNEGHVDGVTAELAENQRNAIRLLAETHHAMTELAKSRADNKLSNSRVSGVARELGELMKVMAVYEN